MVKLGLSPHQELPPLLLIALLPQQLPLQLFMLPLPPFLNHRQLGITQKQLVIFHFLELMPLLPILLGLMLVKFVQVYIMKDHHLELDFRLKYLA